MDEVIIEWGLLALIAGIGFYWLRKQNIELSEAAELVHERLDEMQNGLEVVAAVLGKLPEMVPQFAINQSPIQHILEFITQMRGDALDTDPQLRGDNGRFTHGAETEEENTPEVHGD
jgi:uncharacterized membrane protein